MKIIAKWENGLRFMCENEKKEKLTLSSPSGITPMEALLMALAGCTGMDVVSIIEKMKIKLEELTITVTGERKEDHPKIFTRINIFYEFKGENIPAEKAQYAVELSLNKYCSVKGMLERAADINYQIVIK